MKNKRRSGTAAIVYRPVNGLEIHLLAKGMPMLAKDATEFVALIQSITLHGLERQPLLINEKNQVMDGRHRLAAAGIAGLTEVPCIIRPDQEAGALIVESLETATST